MLFCIFFPDASLYFRVEFLYQLNQNELQKVAIFINLKTLWPIAVDKNKNNELYALLPTTVINPIDVRKLPCTQVSLQ